MSVVRINEFKSKPENIKELRVFLSQLVITIKSLPGCLNCELLLGKDAPADFVVIETWDSIETHKNAVKNISSEQVQKIATLLAGTPSGHYYDRL